MKTTFTSPLNFLKTLVFAGFNLCAMLSFSQTNTLPPTGNVGIGTTTPSSALQVNGTARIDSSLVVKDSIVIHKTARVKSDLKVDGNFTIIDMNGTTIHKVETVPESKQISLRLPPGFYLIRWKNAYEVITKKICVI